LETHAQAHHIAQQQRELVSELQAQLRPLEPLPDGAKASELSARLVAAEAELRGMDRILAAVFGSVGQHSGDRSNNGRPFR